MIVRRTERLCFNRSHLYTMKKPFTAKIAAGASFRKIYSMPGGGRVPPAMVAARSRTYPCHPRPSAFRKAQYRFPGMSWRTIFPLPPQTMKPGAGTPALPGNGNTSAQTADICHQLPHVFLPRGPARAETHGTVGGVLPAQVGKAVLLPQLIQDVIGHRDELLVRPAGNGERQSPGAAEIPEHHGQTVRVGPQAEIKAVTEQLQKLDAQKPPFREPAALLLGNVAEILLQGIMAQHQGFPEQGADLRAADVKGVAEGGNCRQIQIIAFIAQAVAEARAVHIQVQPPAAADFGNLLKFPPGINGPQLRRLGNINHPGLRHMFMGLVVPMGVPRILNLPGRQLPVQGWNGGNLVAARLHRSRLMDVDMARIRAQHALMGAQGRRNHREIGLGSSNEEMNVQVRSAA